MCARRGWAADQGGASPSTACTVRRGPTSSKRRGTRSIWTGKARSWRSSESSSRHRLVREGDHHSLDVEALDDLRQPLRAAEDRQMLREVRAPRLRIAVDEPHHVDSILWMLDQLAGDQLADLPRADDQGVLLVGLRPLAGPAGDRAGERQDAHGEEPERDQRVDARIGSTADPSSHQQHPYADRDQVEDPDDVIGGGVIGVLLVASIQPLELGHDRPARQRAEEHHDLWKEPNAPASPHTKRCEDIGEAESEQVGSQEAPRDQPAAALQTTTGEERARVIVRGGDQVAHAGLRRPPTRLGPGFEARAV